MADLCKELLPLMVPSTIKTIQMQQCLRLKKQKHFDHQVRKIRKNPIIIQQMQQLSSNFPTYSNASPVTFNAELFHKYKCLECRIQQIPMEPRSQQDFPHGNKCPSINSSISIHHRRKPTPCIKNCSHQHQ